MIIMLNHFLTTASISAPPIPEEAEMFFPTETESFGEGLIQLLKAGLSYIFPSITDTAGICISIIAVVILISIIATVSESTGQYQNLFGAITIAVILIQPSCSLLSYSVETVERISDYGKLLLPVMTAALAAEGGITTSTALYAGTTIFNTILTTLLSNLIIPLIYAYLAVAVAYRAIKNQFLEEILKFIKWLMTWTLKISIYLFTGYMAITGVVSGTTDVATLKATKLAISGTVPVVGNIISDASETILVSAGAVKNSTGIFGMFAILSIWVGPFIQIGVQYILLKITASISAIFGNKNISELIKDFSGTIGVSLATISVMCMLFLVSIVCFMRGIQL